MWDVLLISARFLQFSGASVLLGASLFRLYGVVPDAPPLLSPGGRGGLQRVLFLSAFAAIAGTILWVIAETVLVSGEPGDKVDPSEVWLVLSGTRFGRACLWRIGLLMVWVAVSRCASHGSLLAYIRPALAGLILATFAWTGHGAMTTGVPGLLHLVSDLLHLWAAGIWVGALVPLAVLTVNALRTRAPNDAAVAACGLERFSAIGMAVVGTLCVSGLVNSWFLIGARNWRVLTDSAYGTTLLIKLGLFALMLVFAGMNRLWLAPRLRNDLEREEGARIGTLRALRSTVVVETCLAMLVLLAVSVLGTLPPPGSGE